MKYNSLALSCLMAIGTVATAQADTFNHSFYGAGQGQMIWQSGNDFQTEAQLAKAGVAGLYNADTFKVKYEVEAQYSDNFKYRGLDKIEVTIARALFITDYGTIVAGNGYSGVYQDIYKRVDIHQSNNGELSSDNKMLWQQGTYSTNILAYATPQFDLGTGKIKAAVSLVTPKIDNGANDDVVTGRVVYNADNFNASAAYVRINKANAPVAKDDHYERFSIGADYRFGNVTIAGIAEINENAFNQTENTYVGAIKYKHNKFDYGLSYQHLSYVDEKEGEDTQGLLIGSVNYHYNEMVSFFVEAALYDNEPGYFNDTYSEDSVNVGFRINL